MSKQSKIYFDYYKLYTKTNIYYKLIKIYQKKTKKITDWVKNDRIRNGRVWYDWVRNDRGFEMIVNW